VSAPPSPTLSDEQEASMPRALMRLSAFLTAVLLVGTISAFAETKSLTKDTRFCPSWAEAHERTLASLNNGRPPYPTHWKGCIWLKKGASVEVLDHDDQWTEILVNGKHWFADE
jgi:hypothetical protein